MTNEQFSLCWDNFHTNMSSGLNSLLKSEDLVDVTLAAEGRYLKAHKMILSVCSPYFKELFQVNPCQHPIVFLKDVSYNVLSNLLEFMYQGEVKVSQDDLGTFIKTAEALKIKGLTGDTSNQIETEQPPPPPPPQSVSTPVTNNVSSELSTTFTRKSVREKSPPARKKMLGPASKRFKSDLDLNQSNQLESLPVQAQQPELQTTSANDSSAIKDPPPLAPLTTFKLEPEDTAVALANEEDITYDDSAMDDMGMDNTADYMIDSTDEAKAGTSTEVANSDVPGENQENKFAETKNKVKSKPEIKSCDAELREGRLQIIKGPRGGLRMITDGYSYVKIGRNRTRTHWRCFGFRQTACQARCLTAEDGAVSFINEHHHERKPEKMDNMEVLYEATYFSV